MSGGQLPGPYDSPSELYLRNAMLTGFPDSTPVADDSEIQWDIAKVWDSKLAGAGATRPHTIPRFREIADIYWLLDKVSPFELDNPFMRKRKTAQQLKAAKYKTESLIVRFIDGYNLS
jgi:hypothetical protein